MITVVITSCDRLDLLKITVDSFNKFNTYPIKEFIIVDDSGNVDTHQTLKEMYPDYTLILEPQNRGLIQCVDDAYSRVKTPYIFHMEDDWEFIHAGFMEKSVVILENNPDIMQVWIRGYDNPNGHPIEPQVFHADRVEYRLVTTEVPHDPAWHGFSFNPGLRRLSDYNQLSPFANISNNYGIGQHECYIGQAFYKLGYRAAAIGEECCIHIGEQSRTYKINYV